MVESLIEKYNSPVPRYTSYPTAVEFSGSFNPDDYFSALSKMDSNSTSGLYVHIPFCENRCFYCGCNVIISRRKDMIDVLLNDLFEEIRFKSSFIPFKPQISQLHFGGGTPNFLRISDWEKLMGFLRDHFIFANNIELSVELDPMVMDENYLTSLRHLGFNRVSFGIQDVNEKTQKAINRIQNIGHIERLMDVSRQLNFSSVNVDFIYGLPYQSVQSFQANIDWIKKYKPDRMAMFSYAHIPWIKKHQANMPAESMPDASEKLKIYLAAESQLNAAGYASIGLDHFALESDPMSQALKNRSLHRNFMGYTTLSDLDQLAFGPSAISYVQGVYVQNHVKLRVYERSVREKKDFFEKGIQLLPEDHIRNYIIQSIMNNLYLDINECEEKWKINFKEKFANEIQSLQDFQDNHLLNISRDAVEIMPQGRYIVRHIAKIFDEYRKKTAESTVRFSKGI